MDSGCCYLNSAYPNSNVSAQAHVWPIMRMSLVLSRLNLLFPKHLCQLWPCGVNPWLLFESWYIRIFQNLPKPQIHNETSKNRSMKPHRAPALRTSENDPSSKMSGVCGKKHLQNPAPVPACFGPESVSFKENVEKGHGWRGMHSDGSRQPSSIYQNLISFFVSLCFHLFWGGLVDGQKGSCTVSGGGNITICSGYPLSKKKLRFNVDGNDARSLNLKKIEEGCLTPRRIWLLVSRQQCLNICKSNLPPLFLAASIFPASQIVAAWQHVTFGPQQRYIFCIFRSYFVHVLKMSPHIWKQNNIINIHGWSKKHFW